MNFGEPFEALIIGASGGVGSAIAERLEREPACARLERLSRRSDGLDLTDEQSLQDAAGRLNAHGRSFDLIVNASGALDINGAGPEKSFKDIDPARMGEAFAVNAVGAALALKHFAPLLRRDKKSVFGTLSARVGSIGDNRLGGWMSYRASKAALNQIVRCAAIEFSRTHKNAVIVALHPGTIRTALTEKYARGRYTASPQEAAQNLLDVMGALTHRQTGGFFDYAGEEIVW